MITALHAIKNAPLGCIYQLKIPLASVCFRAFNFVMAAKYRYGHLALFHGMALEACCKETGIVESLNNVSACLNIEQMPPRILAVSNTIDIVQFCTIEH